MADKSCNPQSCTVHLQVMTEIEQLKEDIKELKESIKDKVDTTRLDEMYRQVNDMRERIDKLTESDIRQTEALTGIHNVLAEFKEIHKSMRDDYNKLVASQVETQISISEISGMMKSSKGSDTKGPWFVSLFKNNNWLQVGLFLLIVFVVFMGISHWSDIVAILMNLTGE